MCSQVEKLLSGLRICGDDFVGIGDGGIVSLMCVEVKATVVHAVGQIEITQVYKNHTSFPIEVVYFFPIDSCAAVTLFQAEFDDGTVVKGVVKKKEEAAKEYKKVLKERKTAFLGEQLKRDIFNIKLGHLNAGVRVKVIIGYVTEVKNDPGTSSMRFVLPTTVAPRYNPLGNPAISDKANKKNQHCNYSAVPLNINLGVSMNGEIQSVTSPTHLILSEPCSSPQEGNWSKWSVTLNSVVTEMDRDFVVLITPKDISKPRLYSSIGEDGALSVMAHFIPSFKLTEQKAEFVILIDQSGSMEGRNIHMARKAILLYLHSLPEDCYFNLVGFGGTYQSLFNLDSGSVKYSQVSLKQAEDYVEKIEADLGGTILEKPLLHILSRPLVPHYNRQVFVLTDGEVFNTEEVIGLVKGHSGNARVFSIGIGASASAHLVRGIANAGGGTCAFVETEEDIAKQMLSHLKNSMQPALSDVSFEWMGIQDEPERKIFAALNSVKTLFGFEKRTLSKKKTERKYLQAPFNVPPIFDGTQLMVFGIFHKERKPMGMCITAASPDGPLKLELQLSGEECSEINSTTMLHRLAALKVIEELEAEEAYGEILSLQRKIKGWKTAKREICKVALKFGLASKYTTFVAVREKRDENNAGMRTEVIPPLIPFASRIARSRSQPQVVQLKGGRMSRFAVLSLMFTKSINDDNCIGGSSVWRIRFSPSADCFTVGNAELARRKSDDDAELKLDSDKMHAIVKLQSFDGSFSLTEELCNVLNLMIHEISQEITAKNWDSYGFATCLGVAYFKEELDSLKEQWHLVVMKADKWLRKTFPEILNQMETEAQMHIKWAQNGK